MVRAEEVVGADSNQDGSSRIGELIADRYRLTGVIARGAMGVVYEAEQFPLRRRVAIKVLDTPMVGEDADRLRQRFLREASALARLEHPNTVRIYDYGTHQDVPFIVMELVDGFSLRRLQQTGPIPPVRALDIAAQICGALREAHALGMVHRDLKPANILITRHAGQLDFVKVVDFGLAKGFQHHDQELTQAGQVLGTPMYMSPEQIRDEECDPRSDIYSLGVVLYRSLTGATPFPKGSTAEVLMANLYDPPRSFASVVPNLDIPPAVEWVVTRCLQKRPEDRFANVQELQKALNAARRAVEDPSKRHIELRFDAGHTILPEDVTELSHSSMNVTRPSVLSSPGSSPGTDAGVAAARPAISRFGAVPDWMVMLGLALMVVLGVVAGVLVERSFRPAPAPAPVVAVQAPPASAVPPPSP